MAKRLIDANELPITTLTDGGYWAKDVIYKSDVDAAPTVDAVEVVRCKDCSWRDAEGDCLNPKCGKSWYGCHVPDEHYCSYGERKSGTHPQKEGV